MIKFNTNCKHLAWNEKCLPCMFGFAVNYKKEIEKDGLDKTIDRIKTAGGFLV